MFFSVQTGGFYDAFIHGARRILVADPAWIRPTVDVVLLPGESALAGDEQVTNTGAEPITLRNVPDVNAIPDMVEVDNPDCLIPIDAVEITKERHAELFDGQFNGKRIAAGGDGYPLLVDPLPPSIDHLVAIERVWRDGVLAATDGVVSRHRDETEEGGSTSITAEQYTELQAYRRQLRDWPQGAEFPLAEHQPIAPLWLTEPPQ